MGVMFAKAAEDDQGEKLHFGSCLYMSPILGLVVTAKIIGTLLGHVTPQ